ncbi:MAG: hypothetical protein PHT59_07810 [Candidatus Omnitrophica bacterium]|nr:hypothetical protein [Candidatus Omnitrophota bacterium]
MKVNHLFHILRIDETRARILTETTSTIWADSSTVSEAVARIQEAAEDLTANEYQYVFVLVGRLVEQHHQRMNRPSIVRELENIFGADRVHFVARTYSMEGSDRIYAAEPDGDRSDPAADQQQVAREKSTPPPHAT